jgi:sulfite exporter TauE/SafE
VALTPVFLLSGIATLLNVFATRLARVGDKVEAVTKALDDADDEQQRVLQALLMILHRRSVALDFAVILGAIAGAATCGAVLAMFVGALSEETMGAVLFGLFGLAVVCALCAIVASRSRCFWRAPAFGRRWRIIADRRPKIRVGEPEGAAPRRR